MICALCQHYTARLASTTHSYWKQARWGRCTVLDGNATLRNPVFERECGQYQAARDQQTRLDWLKRREDK